MSYFLLYYILTYLRLRDDDQQNLTVHWGCSSATLSTRFTVSVNILFLKFSFFVCIHFLPWMNSITDYLSPFFKSLDEYPLQCNCRINPTKMSVRFLPSDLLNLGIVLWQFIFCKAEIQPKKHGFLPERKKMVIHHVTL